MDSSKLKAGDHFKGEIAEDVIVNGKPVIPKGSTVQGRITNSQQAPSATEAGFLSAVLDGVVVRGTSYQITTSPVTLQGPEAAKNAVVPKKGILQFFLATSVRVKP